MGPGADIIRSSGRFEGDEAKRHHEVEYLCMAHAVDYEVELDRCLHKKIGRLLRSEHRSRDAYGRAVVSSRLGFLRRQNSCRACSRSCTASRMDRDGEAKL